MKAKKTFVFSLSILSCLAAAKSSSAAVWCCDPNIWFCGQTPSCSTCFSGMCYSTYAKCLQQCVSESTPESGLEEGGALVAEPQAATADVTAEGQATNEAADVLLDENGIAIASRAEPAQTPPASLGADAGTSADPAASNGWQALEGKEGIPADESLLVLPAKTVVSENGSVSTECEPCACCPNVSPKVKLQGQNGELCLYNCTIFCKNQYCQ